MDHMIGQPFGALADHAPEISEDIGAPVETILGMGELGIVGEQIGRALPFAHVDILRPCHFEPLDRADALGAVDIPGERGEPPGIGRSSAGRGRADSQEHGQPAGQSGRKTASVSHGSNLSPRTRPHYWGLGPPPACSRAAASSPFGLCAP